MLEPTTGSRLLAKEFGIVYDEGAEGIEARACQCPCLRVSSDRNPSMNPDGVTSGSTTSATSEDNVDEEDSRHLAVIGSLLGLARPKWAQRPQLGSAHGSKRSKPSPAHHWSYR
jgi:hypothetical protein